MEDAPAPLEQGTHPAPSWGLFLSYHHATVDRGDKGLQSWSPLLLVDERPASYHSPAWDSFPGLLSRWTMCRGQSPSPLTSESALGQVIQDARTVLMNEMERVFGIGSTLLCLCELLGETVLWTTQA